MESHFNKKNIVIRWISKSCYITFKVYMNKVFSVKHNGLTGCRNLVEGPVSADSANSHQGCFSLVQKANGIAGNHVYMYH